MGRFGLNLAKTMTQPIQGTLVWVRENNHPQHHWVGLGKTTNLWVGLGWVVGYTIFLLFFLPYIIINDLSHFFLINILTYYRYF